MRILIDEPRRRVNLLKHGMDVVDVVSMRPASQKERRLYEHHQKPLATARWPKRPTIPN